MRWVLVNGGGRAVEGAAGMEGAEGRVPWVQPLARAIGCRILPIAHPDRGLEELERTTIEATVRLLDRGISARDLLVVLVWPNDRWTEEAAPGGCFERRLRACEGGFDSRIHRTLMAIVRLQAFFKTRGVEHVIVPDVPLAGVDGDPRSDMPERYRWLVGAIHWGHFPWNRDRLFTADSWALAAGHTLRLGESWSPEGRLSFAEEVIAPWIRRHRPRFGDAVASSGYA